MLKRQPAELVLDLPHKGQVGKLTVWHSNRSFMVDGVGAEHLPVVERALNQSRVNGGVFLTVDGQRFHLAPYQYESAHWGRTEEPAEAV